MLPLLAALVLAAIPVHLPAAVNQADLSVSVAAPPPSDAWQTASFHVTVSNAGPATVQNPNLTAAVSGAQAYCPWVPPLDPGKSASVDCNAILTDHTAATSSITVHVESNVSDPDATNNDATTQIEWIVGPHFRVQVYGPDIYLLDPGSPYTFNVFYNNQNPVPATNVVARIEVPEGTTVLKAPDTCSVSPSAVTCPVASVTSRLQSFPLTFQGPARDDGFVTTLRATMTSDEKPGSTAENTGTFAVTFYRMFPVGNTNDSGSGSLRAAIDTANASCTDGFPCKIAFRLGDPGAKRWHTIAPLTELPSLHALQISVDGSTQTRGSGDTNADGPEVFLDGSNVKSGSGLTFLDACRAEVAGLAIGNFPRNGVDVRTHDPCFSTSLLAFSRIIDSYVGVDPTGTAAAPNERGINLDTPLPVTIQRDVVSGNQRSGIYAVKGPHNIYGNIIGLDPRHEMPMGNGASGVYVAVGATGADVRDNFIAFNHDFGIGIARTAEVDIHPNSIFANGQMAVDIGLDGPTDYPTVTNAFYDPAANTTTIDLTYTDASTFSPTLQFYAADARHANGYGDAQYYLGTARPQNTRSGTHDATFVAAGDWRGKWVCASVTRNIYYGFSEGIDTRSSTSELSNAVEVK